jgi:hypothetical protein
MQASMRISAKLSIRGIWEKMGELGELNWLSLFDDPNRKNSEAIWSIEGNCWNWEMKYGI